MSVRNTRYVVGWALVAAAVVSIGGVGNAIDSATHETSMPGMDMQSQSPDSTQAKPTMPEGYAEVRIAPDVQQRIGVTLGRVERSDLSMTIRAVGIVQPNETKVAHIHVKTEGWVEKLYVSYTGQKVKAGDALLSIYSPTFFAAQREFLSAARAARAGAAQLGDSQALVDTARRRLELWDIPEDEIRALEKSGEPRRTLTLRSPISGTVLEKQAFAGQYVMPQSDLYVVADLSTVWMQARVFQYELPHVAVGMPVTVSIASAGLQPLAGKVVFIDPIVDEMTRSAQVRIELPNPGGQLRPGMYGDVLIAHAMGSGLTVPASAVIRTGERDIAFRVISADRFAPVEVKINPMSFGDRFEVVQGLNAGDRVVTSANFLIDSESRLEAGAGSMAGMPGMPGMPGMDSGGATDHKQHSAQR